MSANPLLAKSDGTTLSDHTHETVEAALMLRYCLGAAPDVSRAAKYHDIGKICWFFQQRMKGGSPGEWYRHELFSLLIAIGLPQTCGLSYLDFAAIATHHRNIDDDQLAAWADDSADIQIKRLATEQLSSNWLAAEILFRDMPHSVNVSATIKFLSELRPQAESTTVWAELGCALARHRAALVAADHLASSGVGRTITGESVKQVALDSYARNAIKGWRGWRGIQRSAARKIGSAALIAPTGSGKTEAALLWAVNNRVGGRKYARIFYVLPYQVSINAMAERLAKVFPSKSNQTSIANNSNIAVLHSNSDLAYLQDALNDNLAPQRALEVAKANRDAARKIYSPIKVTTVYQLLDIFFGRKFFEVGLLELTNSLVIFDEIHAYDGHTMGLILVLLKYLQKLNARMFIMTATLPDVLRSKLLSAANISANSGVIRMRSNDRIRTEVRRCIIQRQEPIEALACEIRKAVNSGKKTVVVCNRVKKALAMREALHDLNPLLIHSRFTLGDRARRESKGNIDKKEHRLVISTQVIEVSLDVSFDVMFTELAPADDLLQRFGRVNRHGDPDAPADCYVACGNIDDSVPPYDRETLQLTLRYMQELARIGDAVSPHVSLTFDAACSWIEQVYPYGLPVDENKKMNEAADAFQHVVADLRPMLDAPKVELEKNLFNSVQLVPAIYAMDWLDFKKVGRHMEAKELIVNVDGGVWSATCRKWGTAACDKIYYKSRKRDMYQIVALFPYSADTSTQLFDGVGLQLDCSPVSNPLIGEAFISDDND